MHPSMLLTVEITVLLGMRFPNDLVTWLIVLAMWSCVDLNVAETALPNWATVLAPLSPLHRFATYPFVLENPPPMLAITLVVVLFIPLNRESNSPTVLVTPLILMVLTIPRMVPVMWPPMPLTVALTFRAVLPVRRVNEVHPLKLPRPRLTMVPPKLLKSNPLSPTVLHRLPVPRFVFTTVLVIRPSRLGTVVRTSCYVRTLIPLVESTRAHRASVPLRLTAEVLLVSTVPPNVKVTLAVLLRPEASGVSRRITLATVESAAGRLLSVPATPSTEVVVLLESHLRPPTIPGKPPTRLVWLTVSLRSDAIMDVIPLNIPEVTLVMVLIPVVNLIDSFRLTSRLAPSLAAPDVLLNVPLTVPFMFLTEGMTGMHVAVRPQVTALFLLAWPLGSWLASYMAYGCELPVYELAESPDVYVYGSDGVCVMDGAVTGPGASRLGPCGWVGRPWCGVGPVGVR